MLTWNEPSFLIIKRYLPFIAAIETIISRKPRTNSLTDITPLPRRSRQRGWTTAQHCLRNYLIHIIFDSHLTLHVYALRVLGFVLNSFRQLSNSSVFGSLYYKLSTQYFRKWLCNVVTRRCHPLFNGESAKEVSNLTFQ